MSCFSNFSNTLLTINSILKHKNLFKILTLQRIARGRNHLLISLLQQWTRVQKACLKTKLWEKMKRQMLSSALHIIPGERLRPWLTPLDCHNISVTKILIWATLGPQSTCVYRKALAHAYMCVSAFLNACVMYLQLCVNTDTNGLMENQ